MAAPTREREMTTAEFIELMEGYYCPYGTDQRKAVVFSVVEDLHPDVRRALSVELMKTIGTGWNRPPDWADIASALRSASLEKAIADGRYHERQRQRAVFSKADNALAQARENPDPT